MALRLLADANEARVEVEAVYLFLNGKAKQYC